MFAAARWAIRFVDEDVIVAGGADHAVNRLVELLVPLLCGMFLACLFATHRQ